MCVCVENCAFAVVTNDEEVEGISEVVAACKLHMDDSEVVENCCNLLEELADHGDLREVMLEAGVLEHLAKIKAIYVEDEVMAHDFLRPFMPFCGDVLTSCLVWGSLANH